MQVRARTGNGEDVNRWQVLSVLLGIGVFLGGVYLGLRPVSAARDAEAAMPFVDPLGALAAQPAAVVLAVGVTVLGLVLALLGAYVGRDRG